MKYVYELGERDSIGKLKPYNVGKNKKKREAKTKK